MKKIIYLLPFLFFAFWSCNDDTGVDPEDPNNPDSTSTTITCTDSIVLTFDAYSIQYSGQTIPPYGVCDNSTPLTLRIFCDTIAVIDGEEYEHPLINQTATYSEFEFRWGDGSFPGYFGNIKYFPCNDSIYIKTSDQYNFDRYTYGKTANSTPCASVSAVPFTALMCDDGPQQRVCFSSANFHYNFEDGDDFFPVLMTKDSVNQQLTIQYTSTLSLTIPTDSTLKVLPGDYYIGTPPAGGYEIIDFDLDFYNEFPINFSDFSSGILKFVPDGNEFIFSFELISCENGHWTGYHKGSYDL